MSTRRARRSAGVPSLPWGYRSVLAAGAVATAVVGCGAQDLSSGGNTGGATASSDPGRGGSPGPEGGGAGGASGSGARGGGMAGMNAAGAADNSKGGSGGSGTAGANVGKGGAAGKGTAGGAGSSLGGAGGAGLGNAFGLFCEAPYDQGAPWPGAGRCADRGGRRIDAGPKQLLSVKAAAVGAPVATTPIVGAEHVFVATDVGVVRFGRSLDPSSKVVRLSGKFGAEAVLDATRVFAISRDGKLHFASQAGDDVEQTLNLAKPNDKLPDEAAGWTSPPLLTDGLLLVASPFGDIVRVSLDDKPKLLERVPTSGAAAGGALALDRAGGRYLPTAVGVFRYSADWTQVEHFGQAAVARTPVATEDGVLFADVTGLLHRIVASTDTQVDSASFVGAKLPENPGSFAAFGNLRYSIAIGKSVQIVTLNDTSGSKGPVVDAVNGETFYTTAATLFAPPAIDGQDWQYVASSDGALYVIDDDGALVDSFLTEGALSSQPALVPNGLYLGSMDGNVYHLTGQADPSPGGNGGAAGSGGATAGAAGKSGAAGSGGKAGSAGAGAGGGGAGGLSGVAGKGNGGNGGTL